MPFPETFGPVMHPLRSARQVYESLVDGERILVHAPGCDIFAVLQRIPDGLVRRGRAIVGCLFNNPRAFEHAFVDSSPETIDFVRQAVRGQIQGVSISARDLLSDLPFGRPVAEYNLCPTRFRIGRNGHIEFVDLALGRVQELHRGEQLLLDSLKRFMHFNFLRREWLAPSIVLEGLPLLGTAKPLLVHPPPSRRERFARRFWADFYPEVRVTLAGVEHRITAPPMPEQLDLLRGYEEFLGTPLFVPSLSIPMLIGDALLRTPMGLPAGTLRELGRALRTASPIPRGLPPIGNVPPILRGGSHRPPENESEPRVRRLNDRLREQGVGTRVNSACRCSMCLGALSRLRLDDRLRVDGPMADADGIEEVAEQQYGDGYIPARTSVKTRQENTAERTVDAVLGDIDELLAEYEGATCGRSEGESGSDD